MMKGSYKTPSDTKEPLDYSYIAGNGKIFDSVHETCSKHLSDAVPFLNALKQGDALLPLLFNVY
jgi:hypothetical protein